MIREKHRRERPNASSQAQPLASVEPAPRVARYIYIYILNRRNVVEFGKVAANTSTLALPCRALQRAAAAVLLQVDLLR